MFHKISFSFLVLSGLALTIGALISPAVAQNNAFRLDASIETAIVLPKQASLPEQTAAEELKDYLTRRTGGKFVVQAEGVATSKSPTIYVGDTSFAQKAGVAANVLQSEEWRIMTRDKAMVLVGGGTRGTLYAVYHFLEDIAGVRWWNPWEETVPPRSTLPVPKLDRRGKPVFGYRDIYALYGRDEGRFMARNRLNRDGDGPVAARYGGSRNYGPPYHVHTFYNYIKPEKYFAEHPDWFLVAPGNTPTSSNSQLAMSNPGLRQEFLKLLKENIRSARQDAKEKGLPMPAVFSVSQQDNDTTSFIAPGTADKELVKKNGGAESAVLIDFINYLADGIKDEFPDTFIDTLAYQRGEKVPTSIRPRDNVIVRLTDTTSNLLLPVTDERNHEFRKNLEDWSKITKNLRVWDYALTFYVPGLPTPTVHTYPTDLRFLAAHNVEGLFVEHEYPILADMRDFKIWMQCKLFEDPNRDYDGLVREFTDSFYGAAGKQMRQYLSLLENQVKASGKIDNIHWFAPAHSHTYLTLDFAQRANAVWDAAAKAVAGDAVLERRVRHGRLSLDRATLLFHEKWINGWVEAGHTPETMPVDRALVARRVLQTWNEQIDMRFPEGERDAERKAAMTEVTMLTAGPTYLPLPAKFKDVPRADIIALNPFAARTHNAGVNIPDPTAESGAATRIEFADADLEKNRMPIPWGAYDTLGRKELILNSFKAEDVPGPGYHWYKLGTVTPSDNSYLYFTWSWVLQFDLDSRFSGQKTEIWASVKFEGPAFPHGKADEKNAMSIERVVMVRKP